MSAYERWQQARYEALQETNDAAAAQRHAARAAKAQRATEEQEARIKAAIDEAVRTAVQGLLGERTPVVESAPQAPSEVPAEADVTPLHKLEPDAWQARASQYWAGRPPTAYRPMTMSEFLTSQPDDGAA